MRDRAMGNKGRVGPARPRPRTQQTGGKRCSFPWINAQIIAASETGLQPLLATITAHLPKMNLVNLSTAVHRLAKLSASDPSVQAELRHHPALEDLLHAISESFSCLEASEAQPQSLSNVAWSLATLRLMNRPLVQVVAALAVANISSFKPFELSTMLWAFAKLGSVDAQSWCAKPLFHAAAAHIMKQVQHFGFRCLATTAWAFATARQRHARLFRSIAAQMVPMVHVANCQEMANTAWAFGTADFHDDQLFNELADKAMLRLEEFKPQELSNILWGFATNGFFHEGFFTSSALVAQRMDLQAQHLANILWAFARVRARHPLTQSTILSLLPLCTMQLETFKPQEVSSTALAVAKAFAQFDDLERPPLSTGAPLPRGGVAPLLPQVMDFFNAVLPWAMPRLREFSAQSLANTVSAYAMVQVVGAHSLFAAIGSEVLGRYNGLEPAALLHLLKGFSAVPPQVGGTVVQALAAGLAQHIEELRPQEMQSLSRICVALLGLRRGRELGCEELRSCCIALSNGEAIGALPLPLIMESERPCMTPVTGLTPMHQGVMSWPESLRNLPEEVLMAVPISPPGGAWAERGAPMCSAEAALLAGCQLPLSTGGCPWPEVRAGVAAGESLAGPEQDLGLQLPSPMPLLPVGQVLGGAGPLPVGPLPVGPLPVGPVPLASCLGPDASRMLAGAIPPGVDPALLVAASLLQQSAGSDLQASIGAPHAVGYIPGSERVTAQEMHGLPYGARSPYLEFGPSKATSPQRPALRNPKVRAQPPSRAPQAWKEPPLSSISEVLMGVPAEASAVLRPGLVPPPLLAPSAIPVRTMPAARGNPLMAVQELVPMLGAMEDLCNAQVRAQALMPLLEQQMNIGRRLNTTFARGRPQMSSSAGDTSFRCSVKNSFLHVELSDNSDEDMDDSWDGGSSQRSSSVPSRFDREEGWEDWHRRHYDIAQQDWNRRYPDLDGLDFDWGNPANRRAALAAKPPSGGAVPVDVASIAGIAGMAGVPLVRGVPGAPRVPVVPGVAGVAPVLANMQGVMGVKRCLPPRDLLPMEAGLCLAK